VVADPESLSSRVASAGCNKAVAGSGAGIVAKGGSMVASASPSMRIFAIMATVY
jgi:hypothetical protein